MMRRYLSFGMFILLSLRVWGDMTLYPAKACEAYNNLKHTQNRDNVRLEMTQTYNMLRHHKGQYLIKVPGATPSQRWVDDDCLTLRPRRGTPLYGKTAHPSEATKASQDTTRPSGAQPLLLALSWKNAFCETHRNARECRRSFSGTTSDNRFTLHGLWPQPKKKVYCNVPRRFIHLDKRGQWSRLPEPQLSDKTRRALQEVMPATVSYLHRHEWIKHGTCYGGDAEAYFAKAATLTKAFNASKVAALFRANIGKRLSLRQVRFAMDRSFGKGAGKRVELRCKRGMITEVWVHLYGGQQEEITEMLRRARPVRSRCKSGIVDAAGYR